MKKNTTFYVDFLFWIIYLHDVLHVEKRHLQLVFRVEYSKLEYSIESSCPMSFSCFLDANFLRIVNILQLWYQLSFLFVYITITLKDEIFIGQGGENKQESNQDQGNDEMDMGDMDKLEQDTGNIGEVSKNFPNF